MKKMLFYTFQVTGRNFGYFSYFFQGVTEPFPKFFQERSIPEFFLWGGKGGGRGLCLRRGGLGGRRVRRRGGKRSRMS
jgi:hypothetical protein